MPRQSSSGSLGSRSIDDADLARTLREAAELLREYPQGIRHGPDQLPAIGFAMTAEAVLVDRLADQVERRP